MPAIFLNYRRTDAHGTVRHLAEKLRASFGEDQVFRDCENLEAGVRFRNEIRDSIQSSTVVLVVIGPGWLDAKNEAGQRRIEQENDYVRFEIETALELGVTLIPVLVDGGRILHPEELPPSLRGLLDHQVQELTEKHWRDDFEGLIATLERLTELRAHREGDGQAVRERPWEAIVRAVTSFVPDFLNLLRQPARFLTSKNSGRKQDLTCAFVFFVLSVALARLLLFLSYKSEEALSPTGIICGLLLWTACTLLFSFPLWLAWWLVMARRHYVRVLIVLLYQAAVALVMFSLSGAITTTGMEISRPGTMKRVMEIAGQRSDGWGRQVMDVYGEVMVGRGPFIWMGFALAVLAGAAFWLLLSWREYRRLGIGRLRSTMAFIMFVLLAWAPFALFAWLGTPPTSAPGEDSRVPGRAEIHRDGLPSPHPRGGVSAPQIFSRTP